MIAALALLAQLNTNVARPASGTDGTFGVEGVRGVEDPVQLQLGFDAQLLPVRHAARIGDRELGWAQLSARLDTHFSFFATLPAVVRQSGVAFGVGDIRLGLKRTLSDWIAAQVALEIPTAHDGSLAGDGRFVGEGLVAVSRKAGALEWLGNALLRLRPPRDLGDARLGTMLGLRGAVAWTPPDRRWLRRAFGEVELGMAFRTLAQESTPLEWRAGATWCPLQAAAVELTAGTRLDDGLGAPSARAALSLRYAPSLCAPPEEKPRETDADILAALAREREAHARADEAVKERALLEQSERDARERAVQLEQLDLLAASEADALARASALADDDTRDTDGDGVPDRLDNCPREKGPASNHGCPLRKKQLVVLHEDRLDILSKVFFATGAARIDRRSYALLDQVAQVLKSHPDVLLVEVQGHTDDRGAAERNTALSQARAEAVVRYLRKKGVPEERLQARGLGAARPLEANTSAAGREKNRRVEFHVLKRRAARTVLEVTEPAGR